MDTHILKVYPCLGLYGGGRREGAEEVMVLERGEVVIVLEGGGRGLRR